MNQRANWIILHAQYGITLLVCVGHSSTQSCGYIPSTDLYMLMYHGDHDIPLPLDLSILLRSNLYIFDDSSSAGNMGGSGVS